MSILDAYHTLGVDPDAAVEEVELAYRRLIKTNHPDTGGNTRDAATINDAYARVREWMSSDSLEVVPDAVVDAAAPSMLDDDFAAEPSDFERRPLLLKVVGASLLSLVLMRLDFAWSKLGLMPRLVLTTPTRRERLRRAAQERFENYWWERYSAGWDAYAPLPQRGRRGLFDYSKARLFGSLRY